MYRYEDQLTQELVVKLWLCHDYCCSAVQNRSQFLDREALLSQAKVLGDIA